jgi:alanine-glyoxylate transaminase/serine-glyoxylate transaminase/serine-pyruvate transaminase
LRCWLDRRKFKLNVDFLPGDWRRGVAWKRLSRLAGDRAHQAVMVIHNETSTGCVTPPLEVRKALDRTNIRRC